MEAHLCSLCTSVALYPQAQQQEDRHGRLIGYIELNCKTECDVDTLRLRLMGRSKSRANASTYDENNSQSLQHQGSPFQHFLVKEATLFDIHTGQRLDLSGLKKLSKGKHILSYEFMVPAKMPSSQDNPFEKVTYEITLFVRGRPSKSFFSMGFTHNPVQSVAVEVHPSPNGIQGLNKLDLDLRQASGSSSGQDLRASMSSNNARFGGCFNLVLLRSMRNGHDTLKVVDLCLTLEQIWIARGEKVNSATLEKTIADMSSFKTDWVQEENLTARHDVHVETLSSNDSSTEEAKSSTFQDPINSPPPYQPKSDQRLLQGIKFHDYFPSCTENEDDKSNLAKVNMGWQASTPSRTLDDVRIEHKLTLVVKYIKKDADNTIERLTLTAPITLVTEAFRTASLQLPEYTTGTVVEPDFVDDLLRKPEPFKDAALVGES